MTEASFNLVHMLTKHKMPSTDGEIVKEAMSAGGWNVIQGPKKQEWNLESAITDVQLGANNVPRRVTALSADVV